MKSLLQRPWFTTTIGILAGILILSGSFYYLFREHLPQSTFTFLGERAFGDLSLEQAVTTEDAVGAGGGSASSLRMYPIVADEFPYPQEVIAYEYLYQGELPDLTTVDPTVYRRVNTFALPTVLSDSFSQLTIGILSLSTFNNLGIQTISLNESDETGYTVALDIPNNTLSISRQNEYWQTFDTTRTLSASDIPSNEALIEKANQFLVDHQINASSFGTPTVDRAFIDPESWVPDAMSVIYPALVEDTEVWSLWGQPSGLSVSVSLRTGEVDNLWAPGAYSLEASAYELTTNSEEVLAVAQRGGLWEYVPENADVTYTFLLGEPELVLAEHYQYDAEEGSTILYVPAFQFPVVEGDANAPYQRPWIIVPLVKDILDEAGRPFPTEPFLLEEKEILPTEVVK